MAPHDSTPGLRSVKMDYLTRTLLALCVIFVFSVVCPSSSFVVDDAGLPPGQGAPFGERPSGRCPNIRNALRNGRVKLRSRGRIAKFVCNPGFELVGKRFATCIRGFWNYPVPVCVARGCRNLRTPRNGYMLYLYRGALATFTCGPGYVLRGSPTLFCDGREWNSTTPECVVSIRNPMLACDFERDDLCGWTHDPSHEFDWKRQQFSTPSGHVGTGPSYDHTFGKGKAGHYMFIEASSPRKVNDTARLFSPVYSEEHAVGCFVFWYHMYGATTGFLRVYVKGESQVLSELKPYWQKHGEQGNQWLRGAFPLPELNENFQIVIEGVRGTSYVGDTAIDDVSIQENDCWSSNYTLDLLSSCFNHCGNSSWTGSSNCTCVPECETDFNCCDDYRQMCSSRKDNNTEEEIELTSLPWTTKPVFSGTTVSVNTHKIPTTRRPTSPVYTVARTSTVSQELVTSLSSSTPLNRTPISAVTTVKPSITVERVPSFVTTIRPIIRFTFTPFNPGKGTSSSTKAPTPLPAMTTRPSSPSFYMNEITTYRPIVTKPQTLGYTTSSKALPPTNTSEELQVFTTPTTGRSTRPFWPRNATIFRTTTSMVRGMTTRSPYFSTMSSLQTSRPMTVSSTFTTNTNIYRPSPTTKRVTFSTRLRTTARPITTENVTRFPFIRTAYPRTTTSGGNTVTIAYNNVTTPLAVMPSKKTLTSTRDFTIQSRSTTVTTVRLPTKSQKSETDFRNMTISSVTSTKSPSSYTTSPTASSRTEHQIITEFPSHNISSSSKILPNTTQQPTLSAINETTDMNNVLNGSSSDSNRIPMSFATMTSTLAESTNNESNVIPRNPANPLSSASRSESTSGDSTTNAVIGVVACLAIVVICVVVIVFVKIRRKKRSDDAEMKFLSENEVVEFLDSCQAPPPEPADTSEPSDPPEPSDPTCVTDADKLLGAEHS